MMMDDDDDAERIFIFNVNFFFFLIYLQLCVGILCLLDWIVWLLATIGRCNYRYSHSYAVDMLAGRRCDGTMAYG